MSENEKDSSENDASDKSPNGRSVTDATHPRFRKLICRCNEADHGEFAYNTLSDHFSKRMHKSFSKCLYCEGTNVYNYFLTSEKDKVRIYHVCSPHELSNTIDDNSPSHQPSSVVEQHVRDPISEIIEPIGETSDVESSGIGTGCSSMVSVFTNGLDDCQNAQSSPSKSSVHSVECSSRYGEGDSPDKSSENKK